MVRETHVTLFVPLPRHIKDIQLTLLLPLHRQGSRTLPFDYLVIATGTRLTAPGTMPDDDKASAVRYLRAHQEDIRRAQRIAIVGGGAVGVQMACDLKELFPQKEVVLVHSREKLMPLFHEGLSALVKARFGELGVGLVTGARVVIPEGGFPQKYSGDGQGVKIKLQDGRVLDPVDFVIQATGQVPNNQFIRSLVGEGGVEEAGQELLNPANGFVRVKPTMQFRDARFPHLFAVGDIADSGAHKAARPGAVQAAVAARNILAMVEGREPEERIDVGPPGIHLTLGLVCFFSVFPWLHMVVRSWGDKRDVGWLTDFVCFRRAM